jgi:DNA-directed RNA polymerase subunit M/transcription elongation factor TFIIS
MYHTFCQKCSRILTIEEMSGVICHKCQQTKEASDDQCVNEVSKDSCSTDD